MVKIYIPNQKQHFADAAETFAGLYEKVTGIHLPVISEDDGKSDLITFGTDADNILAYHILIDGILERFQLRSGSDDYHIISVKYNNRNILFLAGGNIRAHFYAVYDYFEKIADCHYFWDGDVIPKRDELPLSGIDISASPHFEYRGLRYFAHRSLMRFQAEHWDFEDWKKEFDWVLKKRLNLAMLRIGMDDLYQKAYPDVVPYPALDEHLPESIRKSYDDRDQFWSLKYRGELRKKVLAYGRSRGLIQPEDCGTMTHWYCRTPKTFLEHFKPEFVPQASNTYREETGLVWDITQDIHLDRYFHLTETSIREHGEPDMFHTIGLAERGCFADRKKNQQMKHYTYHRIIGKLREKYPRTPLLIAGWDFFFNWEPAEVRAFVKELDPGNTLIFDYTSDRNSDYNTFKDWGVVGKFPWIFGIFQAYEAANELHARYSIIEERLEIAKGDPMCKGLTYWPEQSHQDTLMLDYFPAIAWEPEKSSIRDFVPGFCRRRYPAEIAGAMEQLWLDMIPVSELGVFGNQDSRQERMFDIYPGLVLRLSHPGSAWIYGDWNANVLEYFRELDHRTRPLLGGVRSILERLAEFDFKKQNEFVRRDILDMARTIHIRFNDCAFANFGLMFEAWRNGVGKETQELRKYLCNLQKFNALLSGLLEASEDFSLNVSLRELQKRQKTNPNFEYTLKGNCENDYCRSFIYELSKMVYEPGMEAFVKLADGYLAAGNRSPWLGRTETIRAVMQPVQDRFYDTPLAEFAPDVTRAQERIPDVLKEMSKCVEKL